jgi:hypothetical protein
LLFEDGLSLTFFDWACLQLPSSPLQLSTLTQRMKFLKGIIVLSRWGFDLHFPHQYRCGGHLLVPFGEMSFHNF